MRETRSNEALRPGRLLLRLRTGASVAVPTVLAWEVVVRALRVHPSVFPSPSRLLLEISRDAGALAVNMRITGVEALEGLLLALACALALATFGAVFRPVRQIVSPLLSFARKLPLIAFVPLFLIWFGFGNTPAVAASFLVCLPPLAAALQAGFVDAPRDLTDILRATGTDPARLLWRIQLPSSLPFLSAGLKRSVPLALAAATVAEFVASNSGLGSRMLFAASRTETTPFFASLAVLVLLASVAEGLLLLLEHGLIVWLGPKAAWRDWGRRPAEDDFSREDDL